MPTTKPPTAIWQYLIPSVRDIIFLFVFWSLLAGSLSNRPLADPDIGWHIRTGERILSTRTLPRTDPFSSTMHGQTWFAWEWLYDIAIGILYRAGGLNGVVWLCALIVAATFTLLLAQMIQRGTGLLLAIVLMLLAELVTTIHLFARPHIVSWFLTLLWFAALERWERGDVPRWLPWFFPLSVLLWVNLHGGWLFAFSLFMLYLVAAVVESWRTADPFAALASRRRARAMSWAGAASALATLASPFGWNLHIHIYRYLTDRYLMNRISEFRSPDFHGWAPRFFVIILLLALIAFSRRRRALRLSHLLAVLLTVYAGFLSSRNLPVSAMLIVLICGPLLWEDMVALANRPGTSGWLRTSLVGIVEFSDRMGQQELKTRGHLWPSVAVLVALAVCVNGGRLGSRRIIDAHFDSSKLPIAASDFLQSQPNRDPVFSTDSWGSYLIYRMYPTRQVVIDDRHDLYGSARVRDMLILTQGETGWRDVLERWHIQTVLLPRGSTLANLLRELPQGWRKTYTDEVAVVYEKR
ncbi:MAG TPA: hypothetical protein VMI10_01565 [Terriglobales bacterium]|nr:hypothetical protein [Terriglobales bacterium]